MAQVAVPRQIFQEIQTDIPRIPRLLSTSFRLTEARRNEIRSQPIPLAAKSSGCPPRSAGTRCFASIKALFCRRRPPHLTDLPVMPVLAARAGGRSTTNLVSKSINSSSATFPHSLGRQQTMEHGFLCTSHSGLVSEIGMQTET